MLARPLGSAAAAAVLLLVVLAPSSGGAASTTPEVVARSAALAAGPVAGPAVYRALARSERVPVLVVLRDGGLPSSRRLAARRARVQALQRRVLARVTRTGSLITARWRSTPGFAAAVTRSGLRALLASPDVVRVDVERRVHASLAQSVALIRANEAQASGMTGAGVTVAVLDTGIDTDHPDLAYDIVAQQCFAHLPSDAGGCPNGEATQSGPGAAEDDEGHGTSVAGIITSDGIVSAKGVAPAAKIVAVKVLAADGGGSSGDIVAGLDWIVNNRPDVKVVNMSLGSPDLFSDVCDDANADTIAEASVLHALRSRGVTVFVASGNDGSGTRLEEPACIDGVISVGAVYDADIGGVNYDSCADSITGPDKILCISDAGSQLDVLAPGGKITAPKKGGGTDSSFGTSDAAPHAAGVAALMLQARRTLTPAQIEVTLEQTGVPVDDPRNGKTFPRVDAVAALAAVPSLPDPPAPPPYLPATSAAFADPGGDGGGGPDVSDVSLTSTADGILAFSLHTPNRSALLGGESIWVILDVDRNAATGSRGGEYALAKLASGNALLLRWNGSWQPVRRLADASYSGDVLTFRISEDELGTRSDFAFSVLGQTASAVSDLSPNAESWPYPAVALSVSKGGTGAGSISGGGTNGIACGSACGALLARGAVAALTATPAVGSAFLEWGGACSGAGACTVTMDDAHAVSARFELLRRVTVALAGTGHGAVASGPAGLECGPSCAASFPNGTAVTLRPQAQAGSRFDGWGGACTGTEPCTVALDSDKAVTATFADVEAPRATALRSSGKRGRSASLRFRVVDNAEGVRFALMVFGGPRKLATLRGSADADSRIVARAWRVPRRFRGKGRFCVEPTDPAGNLGARSCAQLRIS